MRAATLAPVGVRSVAALVTALLVDSCAVPPTPSPVTVEEATAFFNEVVRVARAGDFEAMCSMGGPRCEQLLALPGGRAVPALGAVLLGRRHVTTPDGHIGIVFELCGAMYAEVMVVRDASGELRLIEPEYWLSTRVSPGGTVSVHPGEVFSDRCAHPASSGEG